MALNLKLKEWTEIEAALLELGKCLGIYDESIELENIPKHILWSNSEGNKEVENLNNMLRVLVQLEKEMAYVTMSLVESHFPFKMG